MPTSDSTIFNFFLIISAIALPMPFGSLYAYRFLKKHFKIKQSPQEESNDTPIETYRGTMPKDFVKPISKIKKKVKIHHSILLSLGLAKRKKLG